MVASLEKAVEFVNTLLPKARTRFEEDGYLTPVAFIGAQVNPETAESFSQSTIIVVTPETMGVAMRDSQGTQAYTMGLRAVSKMCKAIMVVNVMEAWRLMLQKGEDRKSLPRSLEHAPGREECIQLMMEHHKLNGKVMMWSATITRDAQERGILGEFIGPDTIDGSGRFLGMVEAPS